MQVLVSLFMGLLFGLGLVVSQMSNPAKVLNFLDIAGNWDPSLLFVMAGAVAVTALGYMLVLKQPKPALARSFTPRSANLIDRSLIAGAALFGLGWGLVGYCPGPAITALHSLNSGTLSFVAAMLIGMLAARFIQSQSRLQQSSP